MGRDSRAKGRSVRQKRSPPLKEAKLARWADAKGAERSCWVIPYAKRKEPWRGDSGKEKD